MIADIFKALHMLDYYGQSEEIEIAKGKYKKPESIKEGLEQIKRKRKWR